MLIDTGSRFVSNGSVRVHVAEIIMDTARDAAGHGASEEEVCIHAKTLIVSKFWDAKKPETVRAHLLKMWPIIAPMAQIAPDTFDAIISEFAERSTTFR